MGRYVFGPIFSRRLGISLGLDLLGSKICNLNCVYCEVSKTTLLTMKRKAYVPIKSVLDEIDEFFQCFPNIDLDYITLSGKGEPTLSSDLGFLIEKIKSKYPYPICLITNSTLLYCKEVQEEIRQVDLIMPSLDAVSKRNFIRVNLPHPELKKKLG